MEGSTVTFSISLTIGVHMKNSTDLSSGPGPRPNAHFRFRRNPSVVQFGSLEDLPSPIPTRASAMLSLHAVSMPGATEDIASHLRRTTADAAMHLHVPRGAASTGNIKVAFCQSFSVRRHKARASRSLRTCGLPGAGRAPMTAAYETRLLMLQPCPLYSSALGLRCGKHCQ